MIPGWYMGPRSPCFPVGIRIRDSSWTARESALGWDSGLDYLAVTAGAGTIGDSIGTAAGEASITTTPISRTAGLSSIAIAFIRAERTSIMGPAAALAGTKGVPRLAARPPSHAPLPAPSAA